MANSSSGARDRDAQVTLFRSVRAPPTGVYGRVAWWNGRLEFAARRRGLCLRTPCVHKTARGARSPHDDDDDDGIFRCLRCCCCWLCCCCCCLLCCCCCCSCRRREHPCDRWMAPEVIRHEPYSQAADVYSFGEKRREGGLERREAHSWWSRRKGEIHIKIVLVCGLSDSFGVSCDRLFVKTVGCVLILLFSGRKHPRNTTFVSAIPFLPFPALDPCSSSLLPRRFACAPIAVAGAAVQSWRETQQIDVSWPTSSVAQHSPPITAHILFFALSLSLSAQRGVVLWQIVARKQPFKGLTPLQAAFSVARQGLRPQIPPSAPPAVARLIRRCWHRSPDSRPSFSQVCCACVCACLF